MISSRLWISPQASLRRILTREEELAESTFAQVAINFGEAIVDQEGEDGAEVKSNKVVYISARPQLR